MSCNCTPIVISSPKCDDNCLLIRDLRVGCDDGPSPCGGVLEIDLTTYNDVTASPCDVVYTLEKYDREAFESVVLTPEGFLVAVTSENYIKYKENMITYKVDSPCSLLSDTGDILVCMKDTCKFLNCEGVCDPCEGCLPLEDEVGLFELTNNEIGIR